MTRVEFIIALNIVQIIVKLVMVDVQDVMGLVEEIALKDVLIHVVVS